MPPATARPVTGARLVSAHGILAVHGAQLPREACTYAKLLEGWSIGHFGKYHNTLCLSPQILHKHCFQFLLRLTTVPRENENNAYAKFGGTNKEYYGIFRSGLLVRKWNSQSWEQQTEMSFAARSQSKLPWGSGVRCLTSYFIVCMEAMFRETHFSSQIYWRLGRTLFFQLGRIA